MKDILEHLLMRTEGIPFMPFAEEVKEESGQTSYININKKTGKNEVIWQGHVTCYRAGDYVLDAGGNFWYRGICLGNYSWLNLFNDKEFQTYLDRKLRKYIIPVNNETRI